MDESEHTKKILFTVAVAQIHAWLVQTTRAVGRLASFFSSTLYHDVVCPTLLISRSGKDIPKDKTDNNPLIMSPMLHYFPKSEGHAVFHLVQCRIWQQVDSTFRPTGTDRVNQ